MKQNIPKKLIYNIVKLNFRLIKCSSSMLVCRYTGISYSDLYDLTPNNIQKGIDGYLWIIDIRNKSKIPYKVRLLDIPAAIIKKYEYTQEMKDYFH